MNNKTSPKTTEEAFLWRVLANGHSIAGAAVAVLAVKLRPMSSAAIAARLVEGGYPFISGDPERAVTTSLYRLRKQTQFVRMLKTNGPWILSHWAIPGAPGDYYIGTQGKSE